MKAPTLQSTQVVRDPLEALEAVLPELTLMELRHLLEVLQQKSGAISRQQVDLVQKEIDGRKWLCLPPAVVMS
jgi:hypothetical protein